MHLEVLSALTDVHKGHNYTAAQGALQCDVHVGHVHGANVQETDCCNRAGMQN